MPREFALRAPSHLEHMPAPRTSETDRRIAARIADKYFAGHCDRETIKQRQRDEVMMLERCLEHVRRGIGNGVLGRPAREALREIEKVLERDYALYARIKTDNT